MAIGDIFKGIGSLVGGMTGADAAEERQKKADEWYQKQLAAIDNIKEPELKELALQRLQQVGKLVPEVEESMMKSSAQEQVKVDDTAKQAQKDVLTQLAQRGRAGLTPEERAQRNELLRKSDASRQASVNSVLQNLQARGQSGGGAGTLALLQAAQSGADQDSANMDRLAATASSRALQALQSRADVAGNMQQQEYGMQKDLATARDAVSRFNQDMSSRNVNRRNQAQEQNLNTAQSIADRNVGLGNEETRYNVQELPQKKFNNSSTVAQLRSGMYGQQADREVKRGQAEAQAEMNKWSGIGSLAGGVVDAGVAIATGGASEALPSGQNIKMKENLDAGFAEEVAAPRKKQYAL